MTTFIPPDKKIRITVEVENIGSEDLKGYFWLKVYYGKYFHFYGNPEADDYLWSLNAEASDSYGDSTETTLSPGEKKTMVGSNPVAVADLFSTGDVVDVGIVVGIASSSDKIGQEGHALSLLLDDEIQIGWGLEITAVNFSSYENPSTLDIKVRNRYSTSKTVTINIYVDGELAHQISETISADSEETISVSVADLGLSKGEHFVYCELSE